jgi:N-acetylglutamate synthase-like GNAT family acetyltransferase
LVVPGWRRRGIGAALLAGLLAEAQRLGFPRVFCATATAASLLERQGWRLLERTEHDGKPIAIYAIEVMQQSPSGAA